MEKRKESRNQREEAAAQAILRQAQAYLLHEFYEAVTQGKMPGTPCQDNLHTVEMVFDVVEAFQSA